MNPETGGVGALKLAVLHYIQAHALQGALHGANAVAEFPAAVRAAPLKTPLVVVGVESVELAEGGFGGYYGDGGSAGFYGKSATVTLYFDILCPAAMQGAGCHQVYEALCDALLLGDCPYGFVRMWCGEIRYDKVGLGNRLRAGASLRGAVTHRDTALRVREFDVRRHLNGTD